MEDATPEYRDALRECGNGLSPWPLTLGGPVGRGKTLAALCMLDYVNGVTFATTFGQWCQSMNEAQQGRLHEPMRYSTRPVTPQMRWDHWKKASVAFCDELGRRTPTEAQCDIMFDMLDYRKGRPTIFATNLTMNEIANVYGKHIVSRLLKGTTVWSEGNDRRITGG